LLEAQEIKYLETLNRTGRLTLALTAGLKNQKKTQEYTQSWA